MTSPSDVRQRAGMDPGKLAELTEWLLASGRARTGPLGRNLIDLLVEEEQPALEPESTA